MCDDEQGGEDVDLPKARRFMVRYLSGAGPSSAGEVPEPPEPEPAPQPSGETLTEIRTRLGLSDANTVAAAGTDIPGLSGTAFEGLSPALRREAGLPSLDEVYGADRPIQSPNRNPIASRHAEEDILNAVHVQIEAAELTDEELDGKVINLHISNETGLCHTCYGGLGESRGQPGVIRQFSELHPTVTIRITAEGGQVRPGVDVILVRGGEIIG